MSTGFALYPNRNFTPNAVDSCEVRFESPRLSYSQTSLLTDPRREIDEEKSHHYEDPTVIKEQVRVLQGGGNTGHRKRYNDMYEPHIPLKNLRVRSRDDSSCSELSDTPSKESCLNRCILFFVLLTSVTALILVVLLMFGKVGLIVERNCACNPEKGDLKGKRSDHVLDVKMSLITYGSL